MFLIAMTGTLAIVKELKREGYIFEDKELSKPEEIVRWLRLIIQQLLPIVNTRQAAIILFNHDKAKEKIIECGKKDKTLKTPEEVIAEKEKARSFMSLEAKELVEKYDRIDKAKEDAAKRVECLKKLDKIIESGKITEEYCIFDEPQTKEAIVECGKRAVRTRRTVVNDFDSDRVKEELIKYRNALKAESIDCDSEKFNFILNVDIDSELNEVKPAYVLGRK